MSGRWRCDNCGQEIESADEGRLEWLKDKNTGKYYGMRIVHHDNNCMYDTDYEFHENHVLTPNMPLPFFCSTDGFVRLLEMISDDQFENNDEILEVIKRLFVPNYETVRLYFKAAISEGYFEPNTKAGFHTQSDIQHTLKYMEDNGV